MEVMTNAFDALPVFSISYRNITAFVIFGLLFVLLCVGVLSSPPIKFYVILFARKVMVTIFWDSEGAM